MSTPGFPEEIEGKTYGSWAFVCAADEVHDISDVFSGAEIQTLLNWLMENANND